MKKRTKIGSRFAKSQSRKPSIPAVTSLLRKLLRLFSKVSPSSTLSTKRSPSSLRRPNCVSFDERGSKFEDLYYLLKSIPGSLLGPPELLV